MARQQLLEIFRRHCGLGALHAACQHRGMHLDVAETQRFEAQEIQRQGLDMVHRKGKTHLGQTAQIAFARGARFQHCILREFENDLPGQVAIGLHVIQELGKEFRVGQGVARDVAEDADLARLGREPPHHLDAAEQQKIVHHAHQASRSRHLDILRRHDHRAVFGAQARQSFVIA